VTGVAFALPLLFLFAAPFWEAKPPAQWSDIELAALLNDSPWAQPATGPSNPPPVPVIFATARPIEQALEETQRRVKLKKPPKPDVPVEPDPAIEDYQDWLRENRATYFIVAIPIANPRAFADVNEVKQMEQESIAQIGRRKLKIAGHFPPSPGDPYLRLAFPREVNIKDKNLILELYVPGISIPFRAVQFDLKQMTVNGKLEL
jgi:hypothetical protein